MIRVAQFGAGRIGKVHAMSVAAHPEAELAHVVDILEPSAIALAEKYGAKVSDSAGALGDQSVDAVVIASSTDTHLDLILAAVEAKKPIFCEKPVDLSLERVDAQMEVIETAPVPVLIGFQRRYDRHIRGVKAAIDEGRLGDVEIVKITSRDPSPPPIEYINVSGGLFRDMMIHDLDLARWLLAEEPVEVCALGSCLVDETIGEAGDVDTAAVTMKTASGKLAQIDNSRRATYGYDQRVEAFGSKGMARAENVQTTTVEVWDAVDVAREKPPYFFLERYADAYRVEFDHFMDVVKGEAEPAVTARDGRQALALADAALNSTKSGRTVTPSTIG